MCVLSVIIVFLVPEQIFRVFNGDAGLIEIGVPAVEISFLMMSFFGIQVVATALLQFPGRSKRSLMITLPRQVFFLPPPR